MSFKTTVCAISNTQLRIAYGGLRFAYCELRIPYCLLRFAYCALRFATFLALVPILIVGNLRLTRLHNNGLDFEVYNVPHNKINYPVGGFINTPDN